MNLIPFLHKHYVKLNIALIIFIAVVILLRLVKLMTILAHDHVSP